MRVQVNPTAKGDRRERLLTDLFGRDEIPAALSERLLHTAEVAALFQVSERTVADWARRGRISCVRTPGGHRRYPAEEIRRLLVANAEGVSSGGDDLAPEVDRT